ncbi:MAG: ribosome biogenesis GTPase Der [Desulfobulbaceae bacterium]|nr:ribosome biogenesis GTPase Der [Desulfobulbaceae bacterium]HIJ79426.1 ribosome biogenesis GTPase Der [Deltaproteobacteria bacterium]
MQTRYPIVALVGRPNVGKSSLFNRLSKVKKAIVDPTPGVTRDRHYEQVTLEDHVFILVDTGGIESDKDEKMTGLIREQSLLAVEEADIILFLLDGKDGVMPEDHEVVDLLRRSNKPVYYLVNKVDSPELEQRMLPPFFELGIDKLWPISASHGFGLKTFFNVLLDALPIFAEEEAVPEDVIKLACIGRPNVGKSSLINRLVGEERMVVSPVSGTTRDSVDTELTVKGQKYLMIDTAGIRRKGKVSNKLEKFSVMQALAALERCDVALILIDAGEGITEQDTKVIGYAFERGRACLILLNKWDLVKQDKKRQKQIMEEVERATNFIGFAPVITLSALTGFGVAKLLSTVREVYSQYAQVFTTGKLNKVLQDAVEGHSPPMHQSRRVKFYYTTQITSSPPTFLLFVNYPKGVHFSYYRYLVNQFRTGLKIDKTPIKLLLRERKRKQYD